MASADNSCAADDVRYPGAATSGACSSLLKEEQSRLGSADPVFVPRESPRGPRRRDRNHAIAEVAAARRPHVVVQKRATAARPMADIDRTDQYRPRVSPPAVPGPARTRAFPTGGTSRQTTEGGAAASEYHRANDVLVLHRTQLRRQPGGT
jgi:hypothetical protein